MRFDDKMVTWEMKSSLFAFFSPGRVQFLECIILTREWGTLICWEDIFGELRQAMKKELLRSAFLGLTLRKKQTLFSGITGASDKTHVWHALAHFGRPSLIEVAFIGTGTSLGLRFVSGPEDSFTLVTMVLYHNCVATQLNGKNLVL